VGNPFFLLVKQNTTKIKKKKKGGWGKKMYLLNGSINKRAGKI